MKTITLLLLAFFLTNPNTYASENKTSLQDTLELKDNKEENDTTEYELLIFDPHFDTWMLKNSEPVGFYKQSYLERWNSILVRQWNNQLGRTSRSDCRPETYIDYDTSVDYGIELNYKLFYFFRYMHEKCRIFNQKPSDWK